MAQKEKKEDLKESKKSEESITSSSSFSLMFGKQKLTRGQKKYKKYKKSLKKIKNKNIRANVVYFYELTQNDNNEFKQKYEQEKTLLYERKLKIVIECYNKIRELINSTDIDFINKGIFETDMKLYKIEDEQEIKSNNPINNPINEINKNANNNKVVKNNKKINEVCPIKKFWKIALINCQFFHISKRDAEVLNYLEDIVFIPLDYPNYKIEFHFKENEFTKQKIFYKEYFYTNYKKEKLYKSIGCDIDWEDDDKNPTLKLSKKKGKEKEDKKIKSKNKNKQENKYVNCQSFFNMFDIDKCTMEKDFIEANFFIDDFMPNILEYYLNIIEIRYENKEDELQSNN